MLVNKKIQVDFYVLLLLIFWCSGPIHAQNLQKKRIAGAVTYISSPLVYINIGSTDSTAVGDTLHIFKRSGEIGRVAVTAISRHSSAAKILQQTKTITVGDSAVIVKYLAYPETNLGLKLKTVADLPQAPPAGVPAGLEPYRREVFPRVKEKDKNIVSGRFAMQYVSVVTPDSRLNFSQPATVMRLEIRKLFGTQLRFSMYGRGYYDMSSQFQRSGGNSRLTTRMYEFLLEYGDPGSSYGYSIGRITSRYIGALGSFDGGQFLYRMDRFTLGLIFGAQANTRTSAIEADDKKGAAFLNYRVGKDVFHQYDGTIAYGKQLYEGRLDREFLYFQNYATINTKLNFYHSTEIDLNDINRGVRSRTVRMTSTFLSLNYTPTQWLTTNIGYDATRGIYLFESMKAISDTLLDKSLLQGYRVSATFRLPSNILISGNGNFRNQHRGRNSQTLGVGLRMIDIAHSGFNSGIRYSNIRGVYTEGDDVTFDLDRFIYTKLSISFRVDHYSYRNLTTTRNYHTITGTGSINYRLTRFFYSVITVDRVVDSTMNSYRVYAEIGVHL
jgi:hypothetical protein